MMRSVARYLGLKRMSAPAVWALPSTASAICAWTTLTRSTATKTAVVANMKTKSTQRKRRKRLPAAVSSLTNPFWRLLASQSSRPLMVAKREPPMKSQTSAAEMDVGERFWYTRSPSSSR